jgi:hypothetical protein
LHGAWYFIQTYTEAIVSVQKQNVMATTNVKTELQKLEGVGGLADDATLATGTITLEEGGVDGLDIKVSDIIDWSSEAYTAGTAEILELDLNPVSLIANNMYSMTVKLPNTVAFFGGNSHATSDARESDAVYVTRTYKVPTDATPDPVELAALFAAQMTADLYAAFTATAAAGVITLTACDATAGSFILDFSNLVGAVETVPTPNVLPVGEPKEVQMYINADLVTAASYNRHVIKFRKYIRHNAVKGNFVAKEEKLILFSDVADALPATLDPMLDGTYIPVADYLGAPMV